MNHTEVDCKKDILFYIGEPKKGKALTITELPSWCIEIFGDIITDVWRCKCPLSKLSDSVLQHGFVVFKTKLKYWSVEQDGEGIVIQMNSERRLVQDYNCTEKRKKNVIEICTGQGCITVKHLIDHLEKHEINNPYFFLNVDTNCKVFDERVYNFITSGTVPLGSTFTAIWISDVYFYPRFKDKQQYFLNEMCSFLSFLVTIQKVWKYKTPLSEHQLTSFVFHHRFVVFETASYYWSVEKYKEGIFIQIAKRMDEVVSFKYDGERRTDYPTMQGNYTVPESRRITVKEILDYICEKELQMSFHVAVNEKNCKGFADRIFEKIKNCDKN